MIPLEVIYEDKTVPQVSPKGHSNPEFIGDDEDDNDIYKAQLLLFLKQSHLIRPNVYPDEQDNKSETSENARKMSATFAVSDKNQENRNKGTEVALVPDVEPSSNVRTIRIPLWTLQTSSFDWSRGLCDYSIVAQCME